MVKLAIEIPDTAVEFLMKHTNSSKEAVLDMLQKGFQSILNNSEELLIYLASTGDLVGATMSTTEMVTKSLANKGEKED